MFTRIYDEVQSKKLFENISYVKVRQTILPIANIVVHKINSKNFSFVDLQHKATKLTA